MTSSRNCCAFITQTIIILNCPSDRYRKNLYFCLFYVLLKLYNYITKNHKINHQMHYFVGWQITAIIKKYRKRSPSVKRCKLFPCGYCRQEPAHKLVHQQTACPKACKFVKCGDDNLSKTHLTMGWAIFTHRLWQSNLRKFLNGFSLHRVFFLQERKGWFIATPFA